LEEIGYPQLAEEYKKNKKELQQQRIEAAESLGFGNPLFNKAKTSIKDDKDAERIDRGDDAGDGGSDL
jgi:hypothetical protein